MQYHEPLRSHLREYTSTAAAQRTDTSPWACCAEVLECERTLAVPRTRLCNATGCNQSGESDEQSPTS